MEDLKMNNLSKLNKIAMAAAVIALAFAIPSFAATTGTLLLQGTVAGILSISVSSLPAASSLNLSADQAGLLVASVTERSNRKAGYTVSLSSANALAASSSSAFFKSADVANLDTLTYTLSYGGVPVSFTAGVAAVSDVSAKTTSAGTVNDVLLSYTGTAVFLNADTYSDTLTFEIVAK